ncbi:MAG: choice-of-anchor tandem repeat GloVer-containing protein [Bryobacteraceae bacterium]
MCYQGNRSKTILRVFATLLSVKRVKRTCAAFVLCAAAAAAQPKQTIATLHSFVGTDGQSPAAGLVQGADGNFYGTTEYGGPYTNNCNPHGCGTVFQMTPSGTLTWIYDFCAAGSPNYCPDGASPQAGLVLASNGDLYGTTAFGGPGCIGSADGCGTVFQITISGTPTLTPIYDFCPTNCADGYQPLAGLVQGTNGNLYGTTVLGGTSPYTTTCGGINGCGTVFEITPSGTLTTLYNFCADSECTDGLWPYAGLVQATDGAFYGTTYSGGATDSACGGCGTVFKITPSGALTTLASFDSADGQWPAAGLVQATNGDFYGTTSYGGVNSSKVLDGTVFKITKTGTLTPLYSFCSVNSPTRNCTDGNFPYSALVQATNGDFYGTTSSGGNYCKAGGCGTVFKITPSGAMTTVFKFDGTDGEYSMAGLVQATNGDFYGTASGGGNYCPYSSGCGTVFSLSVGLGPFVKTVPNAGKVRSPVTVLGTDLTGATSVTFNGTPATFTVNSTGTAITTTVPAGATTGTVQVAGTPSGTLLSNVPFRVLR